MAAVSNLLSRMPWRGLGLLFLFAIGTLLFFWPVVGEGLLRAPLWRQVFSVVTLMLAWYVIARGVGVVMIGVRMIRDGMRAARREP